MDIIASTGSVSIVDPEAPTESFEKFVSDINGDGHTEDRLDYGYNVDDPLEVKIEAAKQAVINLLVQGRNLFVAVSMGKDSEVMATLVIDAMKDYVKVFDNCPTVFFISSDTKVENVPVQWHCYGELKKLEAYSQRHGLPVEMHIAQPSMTEDYLVNVIGGRTIFSRADAKRKCTVSLKIEPLRRLKSKLMKSLGREAARQAVTLIGKRADESTVRGNNMVKNGERPDEPIIMDKNGGTREWVLSPIAHFTLDDIFMVIGMVRSEMIETFSDFESLIEVYRDANNGECMVNAFAKGEPASSRGCGSRTGCFVCHHTSRDASLEQMLEQEKYSFMKPLNQFREYTYHEHHKIENRNWLARTIRDDGTIKLAPNAYHPDYCLKLLRIALTIDVREEIEAERLGIAPRFKMLDMDQILAIDMYWSRYGYQRGMAACQAFYDIYIKGDRYEIPEPDRNAPDRLAKTKEYIVPFADPQYGEFRSGLFDTEAALAMDDHDLRNVDGEFTVDKEAAYMFFEFELEYALDNYGVDSCRYVGSPTAAYHYLCRLGVVSFRKGQERQQERMLQMANQIWRHSLHEVMNDPIALRDRLMKSSEAEAG